MNRKWIGSAIVALGVSSIIPVIASADGWRDHEDRRAYHGRDYRDRDYREHRRHDRECRDFDVPVSLRDVPRQVLKTFECESRGGRLRCVDHVMRDGREFFRFQMTDRHGCAYNIRIACNGAVLGIERA